MGFGWLFVGYFFVTFLTLNKIGSLIRFVGYLLILMSAWRLRKYNRAFDWMGWGAVGMVIISAVLACTDISDYLYKSLLTNQLLIPATVQTAVGYIEPVVSFLFLFGMLWAIRRIAKETEVEKIAANAIRNFVFVCFYYAVYWIGLLPFSGIQAARGELAFVALILMLVYMVLNLLLIFSCYARICDEEDVEMKQKPSRFAFVNRFREELDRRQEKAWRESETYRKEKSEKKRERRKKK